MPRTDTSIDVIIPTLGRPECVADVLTDLARQTRLPTRVIVVEQAPPGCPCLPDTMPAAPWPFRLEQRRVEWVGACRARNLALAAATAEWVLFLDDDVRLAPGLLAQLLEVAAAWHGDAVNARVETPGRAAPPAPAHSAAKAAATPPPVRPWPTFGTCATLVRREPAVACGGFDERLEGGFGEDWEFGLRLRHGGVSVLYAPGAPVLHLKASAGGFRYEFPHPWRGAPVEPRPSPTILLARQLHFTTEQQRGYRLAYTLERLGAVPCWRWPGEWRRVRREWATSKQWAGELARRPSAPPPTA
jgi:hypothetical protein